MEKTLLPCLLMLFANAGSAADVAHESRSAAPIEVVTGGISAANVLLPVGASPLVDFPAGTQNPLLDVQVAPEIAVRAAAATDEGAAAKIASRSSREATAAGRTAQWTASIGDLTEKAAVARNQGSLQGGRILFDAAGRRADSAPDRGSVFLGRDFSRGSGLSKGSAAVPRRSSFWTRLAAAPLAGAGVVLSASGAMAASGQEVVSLSASDSAVFGLGIAAGLTGLVGLLLISILNPRAYSKEVRYAFAAFRGVVMCANVVAGAVLFHHALNPMLPVIWMVTGFAGLLSALYDIVRCIYPANELESLRKLMAPRFVVGDMGGFLALLPVGVALTFFPDAFNFPIGLDGWSGAMTAINVLAALFLVPAYVRATKNFWERPDED